MVGRFNDSAKPPLPGDNVYFADDYRKQYYSLENAIDMHRQTHHASILNKPEGLLKVRLELNMKAKKKTKFVDSWQGTLTYSHPFELKRNRRIIAVAKTVEAQEEARKAGAFLVGGVDIVKNLKSGLVTSIDFDHIICHTDMLINLAEVKGLLKSHFPSKLKGNYGSNVAEVVRRFYNGYDYKVEKFEYEPDFGWLDMFIGRINMTNKQLKENLIVLCNDLLRYRPSDAPGMFIFVYLIFFLLN
jgi:ribosomal protein L1p/L10e family